MPNYVNLTPARIAEADKKPGYSDVLYMAPTSVFTAIAGPVADGTPGATKRVESNHTFPVNKGFHKIQCKAKSIEGGGDATGEEGGQVLNFKYKVIIKGDSDVILEYIENIINEDVIAIFNGPVCGVDDFVQLGNECSPAVLSGFAFRGGSRGNGGFKEYEFVVGSSEKSFYKGTITEHVDDNLLLAKAANLRVSGIGTTTAAIAWDAVPNATTYLVQISTAADFSVTPSNGVTSPTLTSRSYTGLTTGTTYYVRVTAIASGYITSVSNPIAFTTD